MNTFARRVWRVEFREDGGYDCMSAAYHIICTERGVDHTFMRVDVKDFVAAPPKASDDTRYRVLHSEDEGASNLAHFIVHALNLHSV